MVTHATKSECQNTNPSVDDHQVVVFAVPDEIESVEELLHTLPGMDSVTVRHIVLSLPGLIPCVLNRNEAAEIATRIRQLGVSATSIPTVDIPDVSHAKTVHRIKMTNSSLKVIDVRDKTSFWTAKQIHVISVGVMPSSAPRRHRPAPTVSMASSHRTWSDGSLLAAKKRPEALIVLRDGAVLSLASDEMNYEYLEDRIGSSSNANFTTLIKDICQFAVDVWITPSTRSFLDHAPVRHLEFRTQEDFKRYTQFQTLLSTQLGKQS